MSEDESSQTIVITATLKALPCPFCSSDNTMLVEETRTSLRMSCCDCLAFGPSSGFPGEAISRWNNAKR